MTRRVYIIRANKGWRDSDESIEKFTRHYVPLPPPHTLWGFAASIAASVAASVADSNSSSSESHNYYTYRVDSQEIARPLKINQAKSGGGSELLYRCLIEINFVTWLNTHSICVYVQLSIQSGFRNVIVINDCSVFEWSREARLRRAANLWVSDLSSGDLIRKVLAKVRGSASNIWQANNQPTTDMLFIYCWAFHLLIYTVESNIYGQQCLMLCRLCRASHPHSRIGITEHSWYYYPAASAKWCPKLLLIQ